MIKLSTSLNEQHIHIEPMQDHHVEPLRAACALDQDIWDIYPLSFYGEYFDTSLKIFMTNEEWVNFALLHNDNVVGMSNYIKPVSYTHLTLPTICSV